MLDVVLILVGVLLCYVVWIELVGTRRSRIINKIPGPPTLPIIGNSWELIRPTDTIIPYALRRAKQYGPIVRFWAGPIPIVSVAGAEYFEIMLGNNHEIQKSLVYRFLMPWLGNGLLTSFGNRWAKHRKMITPTFHFKVLESFVPVFESNSLILVDQLTEKVKTGEVFDIYPYITLCALDIICETAMGINIHAQEDKTSEYVSALYCISKCITERLARLYLHPDFIYYLTPAGRRFLKSLKILHKFTKGVIQERRLLRKKLPDKERYSEEGIKGKKAFLDLLIDSNDDVSDTDLREEVDTFMFEGHDTTTAGISWALYLLGRHKKIQQQVAEEVCSLWPPGESLTISALSDMKLLERVIKESLRLHPSVPFYSRQLQDDMQFGDYLVPKNTILSLSVAPLHRNERYFPEPEKFDPDRFLPENVQKRHPYAYVPFSAGPRNCIGQKFAVLEEKSIIASLVRSYEITSVEKEEDMVAVAELVQRPKNGIKVQLSKRSI